MDAEQPRLLRSMQGKRVNNSNSKEFNFLDPERKIKNLDQISKFRPKKDTSDISVCKIGLTPPSAVTVITLIPKAMAAGIGRESKVPEDICHHGISESKTKSDNKLDYKPEKPIGSEIKMVQEEEIRNFLHVPLSEENPSVTLENDKKFKKNLELWITRSSVQITQLEIEMWEDHQKLML